MATKRFRVRKSCSEIKATARGMMQGNMRWFCALGVLTVALQVLIVVPGQRLVTAGQTYGDTWMYALGVVVVFLTELVAFLISAGFISICLRLYEGKKSGLSDIWFAFANRPGRFLLYYIMVALLSMACLAPGTALVIVGIMAQASRPERYLLQIEGVPLMIILMGLCLLLIGAIILLVVSFSLVASVFLMIENPGMKAAEAWKTSRRIMRGNKWKYFRLCLSFIGWGIIGLITFFIAYIWIYPYFILSEAVFYREIRAAGESR